MTDGANSAAAAYSGEIENASETKKDRSGWMLGRLDITKVLLALLIVSINIREPFFHSREILLVLVILISLPKLDLREAKYACVLVLVWANSYFFNLLVPGSSMRLDNGAFETIFVAGYLLLLCFCADEYKKTIINSYLAVSAAVAIVIIGLWVAITIAPSLYVPLRSFFIDLRASTNLSLISIDYRTILGTQYLTVWYRTSPCMVCALGYSLFRILRDGRSRFNTALIILLTTGLIMSGTRANMMCAFLLLATYACLCLHKRGLKFVSIVAISTAAFVAFFYGIQFLHDSGSISSSIKLNDASAYLDLFGYDPIRAIFFGWGCGSDFFSYGRNTVVNVTELSFFETIRRYGLAATIVIIGFIWLSPLWAMKQNGKEANYQSRFILAVTLLCYLLVAAVNPYLLDSVGFCALLFMKTATQHDMITTCVAQGSD